MLYRNPCHLNYWAREILRCMRNDTDGVAESPSAHFAGLVDGYGDMWWDDTEQLSYPSLVLYAYGYAAGRRARQLEATRRA